jgi:hypothetical protein
LTWGAWNDQGSNLVPLDHNSGFLPTTLMYQVISIEPHSLLILNLEKKQLWYTAIASSIDVNRNICYPSFMQKIKGYTANQMTSNELHFVKQQRLSMNFV